MNVVVSKLNEVYLQVSCEDHIAKELHQFFSFKVPNAKFMPSYKNRFWDGKIYLFSIKTGKIYVGLAKYLKLFCEERGYSYQSDIRETKKQTSGDDLRSFLKTLNLPFDPRDYQFDSVLECINSDRKLLVSPTASGKSFIIYLLHRWYNKRSLVIVPTTSLVEQMSKDFADYGYKQKVCKIYSGQDFFEAPVTVTTWQSLSRLPKEFYNQFDVVFGDEAHQFKANVLKGILERMTDVKYRFGTTGTLDGTEVHRLQLEGLFGDAKKVISTSELMDKGTVANLEIDCLVLKHPKQSKMKFQDEMKYLISNDKRNQFIVNLVSTLKGNTLVLFQFVEKHGEVLYSLLDGRVNELHYVYGGTDASDREQVREVVEKRDNSVILASYGTFSTGVNIKRINNIVFASPTKSRIRNLQSIGRGLRVTDGKKNLKLYDIADDLQCDNYTLNHLKERINIYNEEKFVYNIHTINLN